MNQESVDSQYERVHEWLLAGIRSKRWHPGDELPSQEDIAAELTVSRSTVAWVMRRFRYSGLVVGPKGGRACVTVEPMRTMALKVFADAAEIRRMNREAGLSVPDDRP